MQRATAMSEDSLRYQFSHTVSALGRGDGRRIDDVRQWASVDSKRRGKDELDELAAGGLAGMTSGIEHASNRVNVDLQEQASVQLRTSKMRRLTLRPRSKLSSLPLLMMPCIQ